MTLIKGKTNPNRNNERDSFFVDKTFKALADPTRRRILQVLQQGEMAAGNLAKLFSTSHANVSIHLKILKEADLVVTRKEGTTVLYRLNTTVFQEMLQTVIGVFHAEHDDAVKGGDK